MKDVRYLMDRLEEYLAEMKSTEIDKKEFSAWLYEKEHSLSELEHWLVEHAEPGETPESIISKYVIFLYRYARYYGKKIFKELPLNSLDDWPFLMSVFIKPGQSKKELIDANLMEKPTGMEIINRLIREGLLVQQNHPADRRGKILRITEKGKTILFSASAELQVLSKVVGGKLSPHSKLRLIKLLHELHQFHLPVFRNSREMDIHQIEAKFL